MIDNTPTDINLSIILLISIVFQLGAAIIALRQIPHVKGSYRFAWGCVSFALLLMVERRAFPLWRLLQEGLSSNLIDAYFGLAISLFMLIGAYGIQQLFMNLMIQQKKLDELASSDDLTGLNNRRSVFEKAKYEINRSLRSGLTSAFLIFDIDNFKNVNDTYGHAAGDDVLRQLAGIALREFRSIDICGRIGGEEFLVVMPDTNAKSAIIAAERFRSAVSSNNFLADGKSFSVTVSIGVTVSELDRVDLDELLATADQALYRAKNLGRNRVEIG